MTNRGAKVQHIKRKLEQIGISRYRTIIVQAGGNDLSEGRNEEAVENDFVDLINYTQTESPETSTYTSEITPRRDADFTEMNNYIRYLCRDNEAICIPVSERLEINTSLYWKHRVHLSDKGAAVLVKTYNEFIPILKRHSVQDRFYRKLCCFHCGEEGHRIKECHYKNCRQQGSNTVNRRCVKCGMNNFAFNCRRMISP